MIRWQDITLRESTADIARLGYLLAVFFLTACVATTEPQPDPRYQGPVALVHLRDLGFELNSGVTLPYTEVFPGLSPDHSVFTMQLAFERANVAAVVSRVLREVLPDYDANEDGLIEAPELTMLYLVEGARALGKPVVRIMAPQPVEAVILPQTDRGGLTRYIGSRRAQMTPLGQTLFRDLEDLGREIRSDVDGHSHDPSINVLQFLSY